MEMNVSVSIGALRENLNNVRAACLDISVNLLDARLKSSTLASKILSMTAPVANGALADYSP